MGGETTVRLDNLQLFRNRYITEVTSRGATNVTIKFGSYTRLHTGHNNTGQITLMQSIMVKKMII